LEFLERAYSQEGAYRISLAPHQISIKSQVELQTQLVRVSDEIGRRIDEGLAGKEREEYTGEKIEQVTAIVGPELVPLIWQFEILLDGPVNYLVRKDVVAELDIAADQQKRIRQVAREGVEKFRVESAQHRVTMVNAIFKRLSPGQREKLESVLALKLDAVAGLFADCSEYHFIQNYDVPHTRISKDVPQELRKLVRPVVYPDPIINTMVGFFVEDALPIDVRVRRESEINEAIGAKLNVYEPKSLKNFLTELPIVLEATGNELTAGQLQQHDEMMYGTDEVDGLFPRPSSDELELKINSRFQLTTERIERKSRNFFRSLTPIQKRVGMDLLVHKYSVLKLILTERISTVIGLHAEEYETLKIHTAHALVDYRRNSAKLKAAAFNSVMDCLTPSQIESIEERTKIPMEELAKCYSITSDQFFVHDFISIDIRREKIPVLKE